MTTPEKLNKMISMIKPIRIIGIKANGPKYIIGVKTILVFISLSPSLSRMAKDDFCAPIANEEMDGFFTVNLLNLTFLK